MSVLRKFLLYARRGFNNYFGFVILKSSIITVLSTILLTNVFGRDIWIALLVFTVSFTASIMLISAFLYWLECRRWSL